MNKKVMMTGIVIALGLMLAVLGFFLGKVLDKDKPIDDEVIEEKAPIDQVLEIYNGSTLLNDSDKEKFLDSILGDYISKSTTSRSLGIVIDRADYGYTYLNYAVSVGTKNFGTIDKVLKYTNNKYVLEIVYDEEAEEKKRIVVLDISKIEQGQIISDCSLHYINDISETRISPLTYNKFEGRYDDWEKKEEFVKNL